MDTKNVNKEIPFNVDKFDSVKPNIKKMIHNDKNVMFLFFIANENMLKYMLSNITKPTMPSVIVVSIYWLWLS